jgi:hypothetical protein
MWYAQYKLYGQMWYHTHEDKETALQTARARCPAYCWDLISLFYYEPDKPEKG